MKKKSKHWYHSKTVIFNVLYGASAVLTILADPQLLKDNPQALAWLVALNTICNVILRIVTNQPLKR